MSHQVQNRDAHVYSLMSNQLQEQDITLMKGFEPYQFNDQSDFIIVLTRGNPNVEFTLNQKLVYTSSPQ